MEVASLFGFHDGDAGASQAPFVQGGVRFRVFQGNFGRYVVSWVAFRQAWGEVYKG